MEIEDYENMRLKRSLGTWSDGSFLGNLCQKEIPRRYAEK